jgi:AcrR family transcriptional regulator
VSRYEEGRVESIEKVSDDTESPRKRPGGRTAEVTDRIRGAVLSLLLEGGFEACTIKNVAERAGIERSTLYRRYPDRWGAIIDTVISWIQRDSPPIETGTFAGDIRNVLTHLAASISTALGPAIVAAAGALHSEDRVAEARVFFERRMGQLQPMFDAAVERGELLKDVDAEELFVFATGSIWFSKFIASRTVDQAAIDRLVQAVCTLYCTPKGRKECGRFRPAARKNGQSSHSAS